MRRVSVFGSTGSVGVNTLDVFAAQGGRTAFDVVALTGGRNIDLLARQAIAFQAEVAVTCHDGCYDDLKAALAGTGIEAAAGDAALIEAAARPTDWAMSAIVGAAGLRPGLAVLRHGGVLALANKESLVTAGPLILQAAKDHGATILPVDSEHSAVFQALTGESPDTVERVTITASGGAFRDWPLEDLHKATVAQASTHPNWQMGQRITIDSASMFNKAMELIETKEFFGFQPAQIDTVIHPESLVHALVSFKDGGVIAHLGAADMRHPVGYALNWPHRSNLPVERLDLTKVGTLQFRAADPKRYPALRLARDVMQAGGLSGAVFNAAKESALDGFIAGQIGFMQMADVVCAVLDQISGDTSLKNDEFTLETVTEADNLARKHAADFMREYA